MLKPSDIKFKFPIRIYDRVEIDHDEWIEEISGKPPERIIRTFAVAWKRVDISRIDEWNESFERGRTIRDVKTLGFDSTIIWIENDPYICHWKMDRFEKEYNKHFRRLEKNNIQIAEEVYIDGDEEKDNLEQKVVDIFKKSKNNNKNKDGESTKTDRL